MTGPALERLLRGWDGHPSPTPGHPVLHFCPEGRRAALVITDHGDRTRTEATAAVYLGSSRALDQPSVSGGLLGHGVRITQGTFWSGYDEYDYLDAPSFHDLMVRARDHGVEVCPHNTSENLLTPEETRSDLRRYHEVFGLTTFLDHGHLPSNLTREGCDPESRYHVLDLFRTLGGNAAWSFRDLVTNPAGASLDLLEQRSAAPLVGALAGEARRAARRGPHNLRARTASVVNHLVGPLAVYHLLCAARRDRGRDRATSLRRAGAEWRRHRSAVTGTAAFPMRWDRATGLVWFDTARVNLITRTYTPAAVDHLVDRAGLHLGHTYLGYLEDRHGDIAVRPTDDGGWEARPEFEAFLAHVATLVTSGDLWNPTIRDLVAHLDRLALVEVATSGDEVTITNAADDEVHGLTLRSSQRLSWGSTPVREDAHGDEWWYVLSLRRGEGATAAPAAPA